jgi:hypothetical protein
VPNATKLIAVTESLRPMVQPKWLARSPVAAVQRPMKAIDTIKHAHPPK